MAAVVLTSIGRDTDAYLDTALVLAFVGFLSAGIGTVRVPDPYARMHAATRHEHRTLGSEVPRVR